MRDHWRLGVVERSVLETLDEMGAHPLRPHVKCSRIVERVAADHGIGPRYGYDALCTMSQSWLMHVPLVDPHGNFGSPDDRPANPRYTEARISRAGGLALAAERGLGPRVPVVLINGDLHVDGAAPPFAPTHVIAALLATVDDVRLTDAEIIERVGPPRSPTGCRIVCDYAALAAGASTEMLLRAVLTVEPGRAGPSVVLTHLPPGIGGDAVSRALAARVDLGRRRQGLGHRPDEFAELGLPLRDIRDESHANATRIVCELHEGADADRALEQIAGTWGVMTRTQVRLAAPLAELVRELVDDAAAAQRAALAALSATLGS